MSQQLVKKDTNGRYSNVMPKSWIEAIKDKNTGQTLVEILQGFNMYFLPYNGNTPSTRCLVPTMLRKKGLWITYVKYDGNVYTEWYAANEIDDKSWGNSSNWRIGNNTLVGDITISANGNWVINGTETEFKVVGEKGNTPLVRFGSNNKFQVSYNNGDKWLDISNSIINNLRIKKYIGINESLPTSGVEEGTIYMKGPYYDENDTLNENPIYRMWVYAWKGNTLAWQDNGEFTSIAAGVVQETGDSETEVMSQKAVTEKLSELDLKQILFSATNELKSVVPFLSSNLYFFQYADIKIIKGHPYRLISDAPLTGNVVIYSSSGYTSTDTYEVQGRFENSNEVCFVASMDGYIRVVSSIYTQGSTLKLYGMKSVKELEQKIYTIENRIESVENLEDALLVHEGDVQLSQIAENVYRGELLSKIDKEYTYKIEPSEIVNGSILLYATSDFSGEYETLGRLDEKRDVYIKGVSGYLRFTSTKSVTISISSLGRKTEDLKCTKVLDRRYVNGAGNSNILLTDFSAPIIQGCYYKATSSIPITGSVIVWEGNKPSGTYKVVGRFEQASEVTFVAPHNGVLRISTYIDEGLTCMYEILSNKKLLAVGDSHTFGSNTGEGGSVRLNGYINQLASLAKISTANAGYPGDIIPQILARTSVRPYYFNTEFTLKGDGSNVVIGTFANTNVFSSDTNKVINFGIFSGGVGIYAGRTNPCYIIANGEAIPIELFINSTSSVASSSDKAVVRRLTKGEDIVIKKGTIIYTLAAEDKDADVLVLFQGNNGDTHGQELIEYNDAVINFFGVNKKIIISHPHYKNNLTLELLQETERMLLKKYGVQYFNLRKYLVEEGLKDAGITPTETDIEYINIGKIPPSLLLDDGQHFNIHGNTIIAKRIYQIGKILNYWE